MAVVTNRNGTLMYFLAGYGATTFPALTEALTFEKNGTLAKYEATRLQKLIDALTEEIQV